MASSSKRNLLYVDLREAFLGFPQDNLVELGLGKSQLRQRHSIVVNLSQMITGMFPVPEAPLAQWTPPHFLQMRRGMLFGELVLLVEL